MDELLAHLRATTPGSLVYMARIRRKLEPSPAHPRWFTTEPGMGYRLLP